MCASTKWVCMLDDAPSLFVPVQPLRNVVQHVAYSLPLSRSATNADCVPEPRLTSCLLEPSLWPLIRRCCQGDVGRISKGSRRLHARAIRLSGLLHTVKARPAQSSADSRLEPPAQTLRIGERPQQSECWSGCTTTSPGPRSSYHPSRPLVPSPSTSWGRLSPRNMQALTAMDRHRLEHRTAALESPHLPAATHVPHPLKPPISLARAPSRLFEHTLSGPDLEALLHTTSTEVCGGIR